jgi:replicative DNA helicase
MPLDIETLLNYLDNPTEIRRLLNIGATSDNLETNSNPEFGSLGDNIFSALRRIDSFASNRYLEGIRTGFYLLDEMVSGLKPGELTVIAGVSSAGKSSFARMVARNVALNNGIPVAFFSPETDAAQFMVNLLSAEAEIDTHKLRAGRLERYEWEHLTQRISGLSKAPIFINDQVLSISDLGLECSRLKAEKHIGLIIIDYAQLINIEDLPYDNLKDRIEFSSHQLKKISRELALPVVVTSQLPAFSQKRHSDGKPTLLHFGEWHFLEECADIVLLLYRPEMFGITTYEDGSSTQNICEVILAKQKNGPASDLKLQFIKKYGKFSNLEDFQIGQSLGQMGMRDVNQGSRDGDFFPF